MSKSGAQRGPYKLKVVYNLQQFILLQTPIVIVLLMWYLCWQTGKKLDQYVIMLIDHMIKNMASLSELLQPDIGFFQN